MFPIPLHRMMTNLIRHLFPYSRQVLIRTTLRCRFIIVGEKYCLNRMITWLAGTVHIMEELYRVFFNAFVSGYPYSGDPFSFGSHSSYQERIANLILSQSDAADYVTAVGGETCEFNVPSGSDGLFNSQRGETRAFGSGATPFSAVNVYFHMETDSGSGWADVGDEAPVMVYADADGNFVTPWTARWPVVGYKYRLKGGNDVDFTSRAIGPGP